MQERTYVHRCIIEFVHTIVVLDTIVVLHTVAVLRTTAGLQTTAILRFVAVIQVRRMTLSTSSQDRRHVLGESVRQRRATSLLG